MGNKALQNQQIAQKAINDYKGQMLLKNQDKRLRQIEQSLAQQRKGDVDV